MCYGHLARDTQQLRFQAGQVGGVESCNLPAGCVGPWTGSGLQAGLEGANVNGTDFVNKLWFINSGVDTLAEVEPIFAAYLVKLR